MPTTTDTKKRLAKAYCGERVYPWKAGKAIIETGCGHVFNVEVEKDSIGIRPIYANLPVVGYMLGAERTEVRALVCPECGGPAKVASRSFTGAVSGNACEDACQRATGGSCRCSCGGYMHGINAGG